jgi:hypothetical protein
MNSFFKAIIYHRNRILLGISILLILLLTSGIAYFIWQKETITPIGEILQNVSEFDRQEVTIRGTIRRVFTIPLIDKSFALVEDKTGEIWCRLERTDVKEDQVISVTGVVYKLLDIPGLNLRVPVITEQLP